MRQPVAYIDLTRLAACFDDRFGTEFCGRLRSASRLHDRVSALITEHYMLAPPVPQEEVSEIDRMIALLPAEQVVDLIRRAGAIFSANAIANLVLADEVRRLHEQLDEALCSFALANRHLSGPEDGFESLADVAAQVAAAGERCFAAWCQSQPAAVGARVRLRLARSPALDDRSEGVFAEIGPSIVRGAVG